MAPLMAMKQAMSDKALPSPLPFGGSKLDFTTSRLSFEERLSETKLEPEQIAGEAVEGLGSAVRDALVELLPGGKIVSALLKSATETDQKLKQKKLEILLNRYFHRVDQTEDAVRNLEKFVTDPWGNALFGKIARIVDDNPPDTGLLDHLGRALKYMASGDFKALFEEHKFALAQIEQLTPQALTLIADHKNWPTWGAAGYTAVADTVTSPWAEEFGANFRSLEPWTDGARRRLVHVAHDLRARGFAEAKLTELPSEIFVARPQLTAIGRELLKYIS